MRDKDEFELGVHYVPYDIATVNNMYNVRFVGMPISFLLLDRRKTDTWCHFCASLMTSVIPNSKRIVGNVECLDGEEHSWVEVDDKYVYDTSLLSLWLKDAYYERCGVLNTRIISSEEISKKTNGFLKGTGYVEFHVAWIRELEENLDALTYGKIIGEHIERFKEEISYDSLDVDENKVEEAREGLRKSFSKKQEFIKNNPVLCKKSND